MRVKYYSIFYLLVIIFYLLRPLMPYFEYILNREYIEKNLCIEKDNPQNTCHGKCHLHDQLNKQNKAADDPGDRDKIIPDNKMDDHLQGSYSFPDLFVHGTCMQINYTVTGTVSFTSDIFRPPRF